jgi:hypothetical protein
MSERRQSGLRCRLLASDGSRYITSAELFVDGGFAQV